MNHLECVKPKRNKWYWYLLVIFLSWIAANTFGAIPLILVGISSAIINGSLDFEALEKMDFEALGFDLNVGLACMMFIFAVLLLAAIVFIKLFHDRSWKEVINGTNRVRWSRFFFGFLVYGAILLISFMIGFVAEPEVIRFRFEPEKFFILLLVAVILVPLQTTAEEFITRGYIAQGVASWTKSRWWAFLIPSLLFGLLHFDNDEIKVYGGIMIISYISSGLLYGFMSIMDDGIELAMGVHAVNNLMCALFATYKGSSIQTYALFEITEIDPVSNTLYEVIFGIILLVIFAYKYKWNLKIINQKVQFENSTFETHPQPAFDDRSVQ